MGLDHDASIACIGHGALATALARCTTAAGRTICCIGARTGTSHLADALDRPCVTPAAAAKADVVLLCVPDDALADVCAAHPWRAGQLVVHGAGALGLDVLAPAAKAGAHVGSLHPVMVLHAHDDGNDVLRGVTCSIDGDETARGWLTAFATDLGMRPVHVAPEERVRYHASAALVGGLLSGLLADASSLWDGMAGAGPGHMALGPMVEQAGRHCADGSGVMGPVARGDVATIEAHVALLRAEAPHLLDLHAALVRSCLRHVDLADDTAAAIERAVRPA